METIMDLIVYLRPRILAAIAFLLTSYVMLAALPAREAVEILTSIGGLPPHIVGTFEDPIGYAETTTGESLILDRRAHTVYAVNRQKTAARKVIVIGFEQGKVLQPGVLALSKDDIFAVADAPNGFERIQYFSTTGTFIGGFYL